MGLQHDYSTMIKLCDFCKVALTHETNRSTSGHGLGLVTRGLVNITGVVTCGLILVWLHEVSLTSQVFRHMQVVPSEDYYELYG